MKAKLCDISKEANFHRYFDAPIVPISLKFRANVRNFAWHFVSWLSEISRNSLFGDEINKSCALNNFETIECSLRFLNTLTHIKTLQRFTCRQTRIGFLSILKNLTEPNFRKIDETGLHVLEQNILK